MTDLPTPKGTESDPGRITVRRRELLAIGGISLGILTAGCFEDDDENDDYEDITTDDPPEPTDDDGESTDSEWLEIRQVYHAGEEYETDRVEVINTHDDRSLDIAGWTFETELVSVTLPSGAVLAPRQIGFVELAPVGDNGLESDGGVLTVLTGENEPFTEIEYPPAPAELVEGEPDEVEPEEEDPEDDEPDDNETDEDEPGEDDNETDEDLVEPEDDEPDEDEPDETDDLIEPEDDNETDEDEPDGDNETDDESPL